MGSANVDLALSIFADWERGDYRSADWADPDVELVFAGPAEDRWVGRRGMATGWRSFLGAWEGFRVEAEEYRALDDDRVLVLAHFEGRGKTSGVEVSRMLTRGAAIVWFRDGRVTRLVLYTDRERAFADAGLGREAGSGRR